VVTVVGTPNKETHVCTNSLATVPYAKSSPRRTLSINHWNVCAALRRPKGILRNSKSLKGVVTAVFGMSSGATGIWWYASTRSLCVKIMAPCMVAVKSWRCGTGYLLGTVSLLRPRKSPHGLQLPGIFLGTKCNEEDQLLAEGRIIPSSSMWSNSCRAICRRSGASRRVREDVGGPVVLMWGQTLCLMGQSAAQACVTPGNSDNRER